MRVAADRSIADPAIGGDLRRETRRENVSAVCLRQAPPAVRARNPMTSGKNRSNCQSPSSEICFNEGPAMNSEDAEMIASHQPYSMTELIERFDRGNGTGRHLLILYSIAIGLNANTIVDIGTGQTTGALRAAAKKTGGIVYSYDQDARRRQCLLPYQDAQWRLTLEPSSTALRHAPSPIDMVMHDGAHDYVNVKRDR